MLKAIIELAGVSGSGKTTVARGLLNIFSHSNVLFIDADVNQGFTKRTQAEYPASITDIAQKLIQQPTQDTEAIDWMFNDLPVTIGETADLITVGPLAAQLPKVVSEHLQFGLNRFMDGYDLVFIDGHQPLIHSLLPSEIVRVVVVAQPGQSIPETWIDTEVGTPSLIMCSSEPDTPMGEALEEQVAQGNLKMVGRIPNTDDHGPMNDDLLESLKNCIFRLNIPFDLEELLTVTD